MKKRYFKVKKKRYIINSEIKYPLVKLVDSDGQLLGDISADEARKLASEQNLDLILINPKSNPPIAKIMDFGKFQYEQSRKERKNRAKAKETEVKEIRLGFNLSSHDLGVKIQKARELTQAGHKIKIQMRLKGRENVYVSKALATLQEFAGELGTEYEVPPQKLGQVLSGILKNKSNHENQNS